jgi:hypothetical protein
LTITTINTTATLQVYTAPEFNPDRVSDPIGSDGSSGSSSSSSSSSAGLELPAQPYGLGEIPIFVRAGAVVPLRDPLDADSSGRRILYATPAVNITTSRIYADRGDGLEYSSDAQCRARLLIRYILLEDSIEMHAFAPGFC